MALVAFRNREVSRLVDADLDEMSMKKETWPGLVALTCSFFVLLPGSEPVTLPGLLPSELPVRSDSVQSVQLVTCGFVLGP
jgi:hypothetical protein